MAKKMPRSMYFRRRRVGPGGNGRAGGLARRCPAARASGVAESARGKRVVLAGWREGAPQHVISGSPSRPGKEVVLAGWRGGAPQHVLPVSPSRPGRNSGRGRAGGMARSCPAARASGMVPGLKPRRRAYWRGGEKLPRSTPMRPRTSTTPLHGMPLLFTLHLSMCANRPVSRNDFITACEPSSLTSVDTLAFYCHRPRASLESQPPRARK